MRPLVVGHVVRSPEVRRLENSVVNVANAAAPVSDDLHRWLIDRIRIPTRKVMMPEHGQGRRDWSSQIWSLICFELWCRTWLER